MDQLNFNYGFKIAIKEDNKKYLNQISIKNFPLVLIWFTSRFTQKC